MPIPTPAERLLAGYDPAAPLAAAHTPPSGWYIDPEFALLERERVFGSTWQMVARLDQLSNPGDFVTADVAGEPVVVIRDGELRGFYNVCRHHAARVMTGAGCTRALHCPYHGWTYNLDGSLRSAPGFSGAVDFETAGHGLRPLRVETWAQWAFVCLDPEAPPLADHLGTLGERITQLGIRDLAFHQRVSYDLDCNWKVYVDNYLDGGYHVPFLHRELSGALNTRGYQVENAERGCVQSCPTSDPDSVRGGDTAWYFWLYPNLMINCYQGLMDVNLVLPVSAERCIVHFDYYFSGQSDSFKQDSIAVAHRVQLEDADICASVQRGLNSRSFDVGRLAPEHETGAHLFHRLLHAGLGG